MSKDDFRMLSLIRKDLWDAAGWQGTTFLANSGHDYPPGIGVVFRDYDAGIRIFAEWRRSFGIGDQHDLLRVSIISGAHPTKGIGITMHFTTDPDGIERAEAAQPDFHFESYIGVESRSLFRPVPLPYKPLNIFRDELVRHHGRYFLVPFSAEWLGKPTEPDWKLMIGKQRLHFRDFSEVTSEDIDNLALLA